MRLLIAVGKSLEEAREAADFQSWCRRRFRALTPQIDNPLKVALFIDLDGTVLDIAAAPRSVSTPHNLTATLRRLQQLLGGAVAILTGRKVDDVDRLLAPLKLIAAGVHGGELRLEPDGEIEVASGSVPGPLIAAVERLARSVPGVIVERKGIAVAVHYRAVPEMERVLATELRDLLANHSNRLVLSHGRRVFELTDVNLTKGTALKRLMETPRFRGRRPLMIGDDSPDEAALETATRLGGLGLKVKGEHFKGGAIDFRDPAHVRRWLYDLAERLDT
jgi:trehalose 6-phosphate phosphatase